MADTEIDKEQIGLFIREQIIRIDREQARIHQLQAHHDRKRQEIRRAPWRLALGGVGTGAALFAAASAFAKLFQ